MHFSRHFANGCLLYQEALSRPCEVALVTSQASSNMSSTHVVLVFLSTNLVFTSAENFLGPIGPMPKHTQGCQLTLNSGSDDMEPEADPLLLQVRIRVLHLNDVPDSGGSFSVDVM